ncbi:MAG: dicarboxylate/amino acid:cation symporter [Eubacteriaceae bacterium]|jgi:proton glutamate symport protein|uniref:Dicarboxylate/amino acid:cation symporter n=1 Tax=Candidatus Pseudoramibacter fermentans TaxID=2594427 RepID=A0A6L5GR26_9FIRM|nr:dicarboxylate/amino acid:cation symporter [Candidatus Pseudoramibacter fermentans]RRF93964.1 MAG: dicarboxylate/amino acid:cation symporter [Eubacteriaceae bacterium]
MEKAVKSEKKGFHMSLTTQILIATVGGLVFGTIVGGWAANIKFIGTIFLRLIQMSVVLLVMTSVAGAVGSGTKGVGKMALHTFKWIIIFTIFAAGLGVVLSMLIQPGVGVKLTGTVKAAKVQNTSLIDTITNFVPTNVLESMANGDMIPCIVFALFFGAGMMKYKKDTGKTNIEEFLKGVNVIITNIIEFVMKIAPIGIFCLLADVAGSTGLKVIVPMVKFLGLLLIGDLIQFAVLTPLTAALTKTNLAKYPKKYSKMSIMALTTTSSAVCLPTKMQDEVEKFGVSRRVADFTGPITMSMNSCGAAQCYVAAIFFMAQSTGVAMTPYQIFMAILLSCLMCMGTISVPGGSIIVYTFLASTMGLSMDSIAILIGIDWFAGMFRTVMNVDVDVMVAMLVSGKLGELDYDVFNEKKKVNYEELAE